MFNTQDKIVSLKGKILSEKEIMVSDLTLVNCVLKNGILYHVDYGSFKKKSNAHKINEGVYNSFVKEVLNRVSFLQNFRYPDWVLSNDRLEFLKKNMKATETIDDFVRRIG